MASANYACGVPVFFNEFLVAPKLCRLGFWPVWGVFLLASDTRSGLEEGSLVARFPPMVAPMLMIYYCVA